MRCHHRVRRCCGYQARWLAHAHTVWLDTSGAELSCGDGSRTHRRWGCHFAMDGIFDFATDTIVGFGRAPAYAHKASGWVRDSTHPSVVRSIERTFAPFVCVTTDLGCSWSA